MRIEACSAADEADWLALRSALWPHCPRDEHLAQTRTALAQPERCVQYLARAEEAGAVGLIEAALRHDHVNGTSSSPVAFVEGLYVAEAHRRRGVARALLQVVRIWASERGCRELASDTPLENSLSQAAHRALGFSETGRVVYFRMDLP